MSPKQTEPMPHQVLIRLTTTQSDVLAALAYLQGKSGTEILRDEVVRFLEVTAASERIQRLVQERAEFQGEESGKLRSIRSSQKRLSVE